MLKAVSRARGLPRPAMLSTAASLPAGTSETSQLDTPIGETKASDTATSSASTSARGVPSAPNPFRIAEKRYRRPPPLPKKRRREPPPVDHAADACIFDFTYLDRNTDANRARIICELGPGAAPPLASSVLSAAAAASNATSNAAAADAAGIDAPPAITVSSVMADSSLTAAATAAAASAAAYPSAAALPPPLIAPSDATSLPASASLPTSTSASVPFAAPFVVRDDDVTPYLPDVRRALRIEGVDGLHFLPNPFTDAQQRYWTRRAITDYTVGNTTNLSNLANLEGVSDEEGGAVWDAWRADLMPQVRWASLGYRYFWTEREYRAAKRPFPDDLKRLSAHLSGAVGPSGPIDAQAAIVNFYGRSHTMGGHVDNAEKDMTKPIVSCSFGAAAIFLIGGRTRDTAPVAIRVRSGDVVLMGGESRVCVHGVPRILDADIPEALVTAGREEEREGGVEGDTKDDDEGAEGECGEAYYPEACAAFMRTVRRVNINVRQMFPSSSADGVNMDTQGGGGGDGGGIDDGIG